MTDLAKRPRGGWQVGARRPKLRSWEEEPPDGWDSERDDVYSIVHATPDTIIVKHFPNPVTRRPCCKMTLTITDADREQRKEWERDYPGASAALDRAAAAVLKKHCRSVQSTA